MAMCGRPGFWCGAWSLAALSVLINSPALAEQLDSAVKAKVIADVDAAIRKDFAHWQGLPGFDYDRAAASWRQAARNTTDRTAFSRLTEAFVASLNNGHTQFNDQALYAADPGNLGLALRHLDGKWVAIRSSRPEVPAGSVIHKIDGEAFEHFYGRVKVQISASSDRTRRSGLSFDASLFPQKFRLTLENGRVVTVDRRPSAAPAAPAAPVAQAAPMVAGRWLSGGTAYLRIGRFNRPEYQVEARSLVAGPFAEARALVIDLRGNGGGNTPSGLGRDLLGADWRFWKLSPPVEPVAAIGRSRPISPRYILIVDRDCGSACEDFAMPFSISARAVLVGETTGGSSGQPKVTDWGNGMSLLVGSRRQWFPDGREFEGVGIAPDVSLALTAKDFRQGAPDRMLLCAMDLAERSDRGHCPGGFNAAPRQPPP